MASLPRGITIQLDDAAERSPPPPRFSENVGKFLRGACEEMDKQAKLVRAHFINGDDMHNHDYVGAHNGLIMTVLEAYKNHRRLILSPADFEIPVLVLLNARRYGKQAKERQWADEGRTIKVDYTSHPDNFEKLAETVHSSFAFKDTHTLITSALSISMTPFLPSPANNDEPDNLFLDGSIPSVTLLGTKADWKEVGRRYEYVGGHTDDNDLLEFRSAVCQLFDFFAMSIAKPTDPKVVNFWNIMCPRKDQPGWLAVFDYWSATGDAKFEIKYDLNPEVPTGYIKKGHVKGYCLLDFHVLRRDNTEQLVKHVLGSVGTEFYPETVGRWNSVRPVSGSFVFVPVP